MQMILNNFKIQITEYKICIMASTIERNKIIIFQVYFILKQL